MVLKNQNIKFGDQILLLLLFPVVYETKTLTPKQPSDYIEQFCMKLYDISCEFTVRLMYACRDIFQAYNMSVTDLAIKSIQGIASLHTLPRSRAIIAFQAFVLVLKEFLPDSCYLQNQNDFSKTDLILSKPNLLAAIINALHTLIQHYKITWKECIDSATLVNFMLNLLGNPNLPPRVRTRTVLAVLIQIHERYVFSLNFSTWSWRSSSLNCRSNTVCRPTWPFSWTTSRDPGWNTSAASSSHGCTISTGRSAIQLWSSWPP